jgi:hypothetical protein
MIALWPTVEAAQVYCDLRSTARGCPVMGVHPRTGAPRVEMECFARPQLHPAEDGRAWTPVDPTGDPPTGCELVEELPREWHPPTELDFLPL